MKDFKELGISIDDEKSFIGPKIQIKRILEKNIMVHHFKIVESKIYKDRGNGKCMHLQISIDDTKHVVFTAASMLMKQIEKVPASEFPFRTIITQQEERYKFI